jgi:hypothetical protein
MISNEEVVYQEGAYQVVKADNCYKLLCNGKEIGCSKEHYKIYPLLVRHLKIDGLTGNNNDTKNYNEE